MATKNVINEKSQDLTIDPGAGDSFIQFDINTTGEFRIGVDDTDDSFRISQGSALGTTDTFIMTAAGERTMPLQPAFLAVLNATIANVTGDNTNYTIVWDTEVFDQNSDFDGTSTFTAPITGRYVFDCALMVSDLGAAHIIMYTNLTTSNRNYTFAQGNAAALRDANDDLGYAFSVLADMDAADTTIVRVVVQNGAKVVDILSNGSADPYNWFSGSLQC